MNAEQNQLITRIGPGTPCGALMRQYWQPVALLDEFDARLDPLMATRPVKAVRLLGQDLVRDVALRINGDARIGRYSVDVENFESIHNHSAYARIERN